MTDDIIAKIDAYAGTTVYLAVDDICPARQDQMGEVAPKAFAALRAVLNLHPSHYVNSIYPGQQGIDICEECEHLWPCPTVRAITTALEAP